MRSTARAKSRPTRTVRIGVHTIGGANPIAVQSMCATRTADIDATVAQIDSLLKAGAAIVRVAVDNERDVEALREIRRQLPSATLAVDLQEAYRLAPKVAPMVQKLRYNPGHLHHVECEKPLREKLSWLARIAQDSDCAIRIGVNCGSIEPAFLERHPHDRVEAMIRSALCHCEALEELGFSRFLVSLKDSDPIRVVDANRRFASRRPDVPLHLGVTEAGLLPDGLIKSRWALLSLLADGIGDTLRVSLTLPYERKWEEVKAGYDILADLAQGKRPGALSRQPGANIVACPSCSRVENEGFVELAEQVRRLARDLGAGGITIAVMGCRVNGPGETDEADLGVWCGPTRVNLKRGPTLVGSFTYGEILPMIRREICSLLGSGSGGTTGTGRDC